MDQNLAEAMRNIRLDSYSAMGKQQLANLGDLTNRLPGRKPPAKQVVIDYSPVVNAVGKLRGNTPPHQVVIDYTPVANRLSAVGDLPGKLPAIPPRKAATIGLIALGALGLAAAGATLMYWFDPDRGRSRRSQTSAHGKAVMRRTARDAGREGSRRAHYLNGKVKGATMKARGRGQFHAESDVDLREHLRQVIHTLPVPTKDVNVDVCNGRAVLRGQVLEPEHHELICRSVADIPGVAGIDDYLHLPGFAAPNKATVLGTTTRLNGRTD